jgi:beta-lactamase class D
MVKVLSQKRKKFTSYLQGIALGWFIGHLNMDGKQIHWIHGATGGYIAFVGFVKSSNTGTVVFINRGPRFLEQLTGISMADEIGFKILEHLNQLD